MTIILYTCMFGNYDTLPVHILTANFDYIPITNSKIQGLTPVQHSRYYKILPHLKFRDYPISVYSDSNMDLKDPKKLTELCMLLYNSNKSAILFKHPQRTTSRQEILACLNQGVGNAKLLEKYKIYRKNGFSDNVGLTENNVIIRKHNNPELILCEKLWWSEYKNGCTRDQVCLPYARWKTKYTDFILMEQHVKEDIFKWRGHQC